MTSRERVRTIISGEAADRCGFWLGNPHDDTWPIYLDYFGAADQETVRRGLGDDYRWFNPTSFDGAYRHPEGREMFPSLLGGETGDLRVLADCETVDEVEAYEWPNPDYLNFEPCLVVSPSHEAGLPNVPPENVRAMAEAAIE